MKLNVRMLAVTLALGSSVAVADKLSDFKEAVGKAGCDSVPYSDLRSNCKSEQSTVHEWCDGARGPVTCGSDGITRQLKDNLENVKKNVEALKENRRKLDVQKSRATDDNEKNRLGKEIEQVDKEIYEAGKRVDQAVADLEVRKKLVDSAIYAIDKCIDYRRAVMNIFASASDKVRGENDDDVKPLARQLRDRYEESKRGHETAITDKKNALDTCKNSRP